MTTNPRVLVLVTLFMLLIAAGHAGPLTGQPVCLSKFDTNCAAMTPGGYTVLNTVVSPNGTNYIVVDAVITGGTIINQQLFLAGDPSIQSAVLQDETQLATSPPACSAAISSNCYAPNVGGSVVVTSSTTSSFVNLDTPLTQRLDQYSTTLRVTLNGTQTILLQTFGAGFNDPVVQAHSSKPKPFWRPATLPSELPFCLRALLCWSAANSPTCRLVNTPMATPQSRRWILSDPPSSMLATTRPNCSMSYPPSSTLTSTRISNTPSTAMPSPPIRSSRRRSTKSTALPPPQHLSPPPGL